MIFPFLFLVIALFWNGLEGNLESHLRKIEKTPASLHRIANIDFIYMINLDERPDKFALSLQQLAPYHITPFRFSAVNGWKLSPETINDLGIVYQPGMPKDLWGTFYDASTGLEPMHEIMHQVGRTYFCHCMSRGAIGIVLSHLSVLNDAYLSGFRTIWVMEDDVEVIQNPHKMSDLIKRLDRLVGKKGWDVLFTDRDTKDSHGNYVPCLGHARRPNFNPRDPAKFSQRTSVGTLFKKIGARYGAYSMIVRRSGMKKILDFFKEKNIFLPFDMEMFFPENIRVYTVKTDVVSTLPMAGSNNGIAIE